MRLYRQYPPTPIPLSELLPAAQSRAAGRVWKCVPLCLGPGRMMRTGTVLAWVDTSLHTVARWDIASIPGREPLIPDSICPPVCNCPAVSIAVRRWEVLEAELTK